ncbi:MAG: hypothetical protein PHR35_15545 [Kiritimatiellae bacterium]|nr:hypothetical protein [Kiritimatiellia bacterium]
MNPMIPILTVLLLLVAIVCNQVVGVQKKLRILDRKINSLLASLGLDPMKTGSADAPIKRIAELYRAGKQDEAKHLAKETLTGPAEFKGAWQACKDKPVSA